MLKKIMVLLILAFTFNSFSLTLKERNFLLKTIVKSNELVNSVSTNQRQINNSYDSMINLINTLIKDEITEDELLELKVAIYHLNRILKVVDTKELIDSKADAQKAASLLQINEE